MCSWFVAEPHQPSSERNVPLLGLLNTCRKLGLTLFADLGDGLGPNPDQPRVPPLAILVARAA